jgi:hypothetical protein
MSSSEKNAPKDYPLDLGPGKPSFSVGFPGAASEVRSKCQAPSNTSRKSAFPTP